MAAAPAAAAENAGAASPRQGDDGRSPGDAEEARGPAEPLPNVALTPGIIHRVLLAEIAAQRGGFDLAVGTYMELARNTRDPRLARRALEIATVARQLDVAIQAGERWVELAPESPQARQMLVGLLINANRIAQVEPHLVKLLSQEGPRLPDGLVRLPRLFARFDDRQAAAAMIERLTAPHLALPEARLARAQAAEAAGDRSRAATEIDTALDMRPDWQPGVLFRAHLLLADGKDKALDYLKDYVRRHPQAHEVRMQYARALASERRYPEARREFQGLLADAPERAEVVAAVAVLSMQLNDRPMAEESFLKLLGMAGADHDMARYYLGQIAEERKDYPKALEWYGAVGQGEQYLPSQLRHAQTLARLGRIDEARAKLRTLADDRQRDRVQILVMEAQILRDAGRTDEALGLLDGALKTHPDQPELLYESSLLAERLGRTEEVETRLRRLIAVKPDHAHAYNALGYSLAERNVRLEEAEDLIASGLKLAPEDPFILDSMGWVRFRRGDLKGALDYLERAHRLRPDPEIAAHLGEVLWNLGRRGDASRTWKEAAKVHPDNEVLLEVIKRLSGK